VLLCGGGPPKGRSLSSAANAAAEKLKTVNAAMAATVADHLIVSILSLDLQPAPLAG